MPLQALMKQIMKISKTIITLGLVALVSPLSAIASPMQGQGPRGNLSRGVDFCKNIETIANKITTDMTNRDAKWDGKKTDRLAKVSDRRTHRDEVRVENRGMRDDKHDTRIDALMAKADTDAERSAVNTFEATLNSAVAKRRAAVDAAVKAYRDGVDNLLNGRFTTLDGNVDAFRAAMTEAIADAREACAADKDPKPEFEASVKAARDNFKTAKPEALKAEIQKLVETRKKAVETAVTEFKTTMKTAFETLKTAFGGEIE